MRPGICAAAWKMNIIQALCEDIEPPVMITYRMTIRDAITAEKTNDLKELRRELKVCGQIQERSLQVAENLKIVDADRMKDRER